MAIKMDVLDFQKHNFFRVAREVFNNTDNELKTTDLTVYCVLCMYANNEDTTSWGSVQTIANKARCSVRTAQRSINNLKENKFIDVVNRFDSRGFKISNTYHLLDLEGK